jgi:hypothetical protein
MTIESQNKSVALKAAHAQVSPNSEFKSPAQVVNDDKLSVGQKIKILRQWEIDCRAMLRAGDEGMSAKGVPVTMGEVQRARASLGDHEKLVDC